MIRLLLIIAIGVAVYFFVVGKPGKPRMTTKEACRTLGVSGDATAEMINAAHRNLIAKIHPDRGGTAELAARVNTARDVLLRQLSN